MTKKITISADNINDLVRTLDGKISKESQLQVKLALLFMVLKPFKMLVEEITREHGSADVGALKSFYDLFHQEVGELLGDNGIKTLDGLPADIVVRETGLEVVPKCQPNQLN